MIRDRQAGRLRVAQQHPSALVRAAGAFAWLDSRGDTVTVPALVAVAAALPATAGHRLLRLARERGRNHVRAMALRGAYELDPRGLAGLVDAVKGRSWTEAAHAGVDHLPR